MRILLTRLPLFMGILLLQVSPTGTTVPSTLTDLLLQTLSQVPVYAILAYIVINIQRTTAKENERRDEHEKTITAALITERTRIDEIEEDRRLQWEAQKKADGERDERYIETFQAYTDGANRMADILALMQKEGAGRDRILSDATSAMTAIATVGSKPLQQVVKDVHDLQDTVRKLFDRYSVTFPSEKSIDVMFKELLAEIERLCADKPPPPPAMINNTISLASEPDELPKAAGQ